MRKTRFNFPKAVEDRLIRLGAVGPDKNRWWEVATAAGSLKLQPFDNWIACRFESVKLAKKHFGVDRIGLSRLNPYSGKPTEFDVAYFLSGNSPSFFPPSLVKETHMGQAKGSFLTVN